MSKCIPFQTNKGFSILCISETEFQCPYCSLDIADKNETYLKRINSNKKGYTIMKCLCSNRIGVTYDFKGDMVGFKLTGKTI